MQTDLAAEADKNKPPLIACPTCGLVHVLAPIPAGNVAHCARCHAALIRRADGALRRTAAFSLAALILYIPANLLPILKLEMYGAVSENRVWDGVTTFYKDGDWFMAGVVFMASIFIPLCKLAGLFYLVVTCWHGSERHRRFRTWVYRVIDVIGRWAMLDVFVLSIWVALVKLQTLARVTPGDGLLLFGSVVILTLLAAFSFDPQLIWQQPGRDE